jgi:hypothetical protein
MAKKSTNHHGLCFFCLYAILKVRAILVANAYTLTVLAIMFLI